MTNIPCRELELRLHTDFTTSDLQQLIGKKLHLKNFSYEILKQSLDARRRPNIYWLVRIRVFSEELRGEAYHREPSLTIPYRKRKTKVVVAGSGPAGFFSAFVLQQAGFQVTIIEKGPEAGKRFQDIRQFENGGPFHEHSNYCHGEGGAGTFSDGKLTSRTKGIALEKQYVFDSYVKAGAPGEIRYFANPHIGSDRLRVVIPNLRKQFENAGGRMVFNTEIQALKIAGNSCVAAVTNRDTYPCDIFIAAPGHSSYLTYRMLYRSGVRFRSKPLIFMKRTSM